MARPRVFVSSTYYDLKHIRSSLETFIDSLGFEPILFEAGSIAFTPDESLDGSCYREASMAEIFVLIVGGRYGSEVSGGTGLDPKTFHARYESITKAEFESAYNSRVPIYILVESQVAAEYQTYKRNKSNTDIVYAHVDSIGVFEFLDVIFSKPHNNPVCHFERTTEIVHWLRAQWAGLFRELLNSRFRTNRIDDLASEILALRSSSEMLKNYLEVLIDKMADQPTVVIERQHAKVAEETRRRAFVGSILMSHLSSTLDAASLRAFQTIVVEAADIGEFLDRLRHEVTDGRDYRIISKIFESPTGLSDTNQIRRILGRPVFAARAAD